MDFRKQKVNLVLLPVAILKFVIILYKHSAYATQEPQNLLLPDLEQMKAKTKDKGLIFQSSEEKMKEIPKALKKKKQTHFHQLGSFKNLCKCSIISTVTITLL